MVNINEPTKLFSCFIAIFQDRKKERKKVDVDVDVFLLLNQCPCAYLGEVKLVQLVHMSMNQSKQNSKFMIFMIGSNFML